jgi:predicted RND superfamily exporter protein
MARFLRDGSRDVGAAIRGTGGAVGLCSLTTIIGYSSLLVAQNVGLFLFGLLAVLGEITCLTAAVVVMPAVLLLLHRRGKYAERPFEWDQATALAANDSGKNSVAPTPPEPAALPERPDAMS